MYITVSRICNTVILYNRRTLHRTCDIATYPPSTLAEETQNLQIRLHFRQRATIMFLKTKKNQNLGPGESRAIIALSPSILQPQFAPVITFLYFIVYNEQIIPFTHIYLLIKVSGFFIKEKPDMYQFYSLYTD